MTATARPAPAKASGPAPITIHPYIGILGVFLGAATSTLNGSLVSVGLPDLRGALGFGFDEASWIPTVLNMGMMFIGVFAVFWGAAYGVRRVLMVTGAVYTVASFVLPFSPDLPAMLALQALAGMSSGAFYTLTLTFVARNLPPKLLIFGIAAYALDIVVTSNVAALIEGWYIDHLSWHWIFWTAAVLTPFMMLCIYFGVPPADDGPKPNWRGFLYVSAGLSLIYGALDQGQRLDWWRSGIFAGMLAGGLSLLFAAFVRRWFQPNPLVNLPFLNARNIVIFGLGVFTIRFALLAPLAAIPGFLGSIQQYRPIQTGEALAWVAAPQFVLVWIAAIVSVFIQPRIVMATGFAAVGLACWRAAQLDSSWSGGSFLVPELMLATGIVAAFVGLVISLLLLAVELSAPPHAFATFNHQPSSSGESQMTRCFAPILLMCALGTAFGADSMNLTLPDAVRIALAQNPALKIARLKVQENEQKKAGAKADYFPKIKNESNFLHTTSVENIDIPRGAFGSVPNAGLVPAHDILIDQGNQTFETIGTGAAEPLTPLIRVRQANRIAASQVAASRDDLKKLENEVAVKVHEVYYGILISRLQRQAAEQDSAYARTRMSESQEDVRNGSALKIATIENRAGMLESEQSLLTIDLLAADLNADLNDLLGTPLDTSLVLSPVELTTSAVLPRDEALRMAVAENPEIAAAMETVAQAKAALTTAKSAYIPDVSVFARQSYQNRVPFLVHNFGTFGVTLSYDVFDFGKRRAAVREREAQLAQAEENVKRLKDEVSVQIEHSYNKVERTAKMLQVSAEVVRLRTEGERIAENELKQGAILVSARRQASAASYKAQADLLQAQLAARLALAELERTIGRTPAR